LLCSPGSPWPFCVAFLALNLSSSCLILLNVGITGMQLHAWLAIHFLLHVIKVGSFLLLSSIPLCGYGTLCLSVC
jgi:hypothetical protein